MIKYWLKCTIPKEYIKIWYNLNYNNEFKNKKYWILLTKINKRIPTAPMWMSINPTFVVGTALAHFQNSQTISTHLVRRYFAVILRKGHILSFRILNPWNYFK